MKGLEPSTFCMARPGIGFEMTRDDNRGPDQGINAGRRLGGSPVGAAEAKEAEGSAAETGELVETGPYVFPALLKSSHALEK
jgi:hypothetical protein